MKKFIAALITGALFIAEIVLLKRYDVAAIGPAGTEVGFSHLNQRVHDMTGVNMRWYDITDYIGYGAIAVCLIFALIGLIQLIQRRSLFRVDREIIALGGLFAVTIGFYFLFEKIVINYRPILMEGETTPEPSFPSSHTVLITVVMIAVLMIIDNYSNDLFSGLFKALCAAVAVVAVGGRLYCGAHWFTDIVGGLLLSITLLLLFACVIYGGDDAAVPAGSGTAEFTVFDDKKAGRAGAGTSGRAGAGKAGREVIKEAGGESAGRTGRESAGKTGGEAGKRSRKKADKKTGGKSTAGYTPKH